MRVRLVCSCGLLLSARGTSLLIDAPNGALTPFYRLPDAALRQLADETELCGLVFTHLHPDHYDAARAAQLMAARSGLALSLPTEAARQTIRIGAFTVERHRIAHTPAPALGDCAHDVLLVSDGTQTVYLAADAMPDAAAHRAALNGRRVDAAFWNSQYLSYPETRALLCGCAGRSYIYHMPEGALMDSAIGRKCEKNLLRYGAELENVSVLTCYPAELEL